MADDRKNNKKTYEGSGLNKKIKVQPFSSAGLVITSTLHLDKYNDKINEETITENTKTIISEHIQKLDMLCDHYKIDKKSDSKWFELSYELACAHIPGFQTETKNKSGAPRKWNEWEKFKLWVAVRQKRLSNSHLTDSSACDQLIKQEPWKSKTTSAKSLKDYVAHTNSNSPFIDFYKKLIGSFIKNDFDKVSPQEELDIIDRFFDDFISSKVS